MNELGHFFILNAAWRSSPGHITQGDKAVHSKPFSPSAHRRQAHSQLLCDLGIARSIGAGQHHTGSLDFGYPGFALSRDVLQNLPFLFG